MSRNVSLDFFVSIVFDRTCIGYAQVGTYLITNPQRLFCDVFGLLACTRNPSWIYRHIDNVKDLRPSQVKS